jgi:hypothetical protein
MFVCGIVNRSLWCGRDQDVLGGHPNKRDWIGVRGSETLVDLVSFTHESRVFLSVAGHWVS